MHDRIYLCICCYQDNYVFINRLFTQWTGTYFLLIKGRPYFYPPALNTIFSIISATCCITQDESEAQGWCLIPLSDRSLSGSSICDQNLIQAGCAGKGYVFTFYSLPVFQPEHFQGQLPSLPHSLHQL